MRLVSLTSLLLTAVCGLVGCSLYETNDPKPVCTFDTPAAPSQVSLVNPATLQCQQFSGGSVCDPQCGPCPEQVHTPPIPTWGSCNSSCRSLDQAACEAAPECRVALDWTLYYMDNPNAFIGCYPQDQGSTHPFPGSCRGLDAQSCSADGECFGLYTPIAADCLNCATQLFKECAPARDLAGSCYLPTVCDSAGPNCPQGTTPGIANGCYTGACIPNQLCPLVPGGGGL